MSWYFRASRFFLVFKYIPMLGSMIAFQDYSVFKGILDSQWVGLKHFKALLTYPDFIRIFTNTLVLGLCKTVLIFPIPVILSLMLNEVKNQKSKKGNTDGGICPVLPVVGDCRGIGI